MASTVSSAKQQLDPGVGAAARSGTSIPPLGPVSAPVTAPALPVAGSDATLATLPSPLVALLLVLARPLRFTKKAIEVVSWRSASPVESWLVVAGWWAVCMGGRAAYKYILPLLLLLLIPLPSSSAITTAPPRSTLSALIASIPFHHAASASPAVLAHTGSNTSPRSPASSQTVLLALADLYAINAMLAALPGYVGGAGGWTSEPHARWWAQMERRRLVRGGAVLWAAWIALNAFLGARVTLALVGSAALLLPSPTLRALGQLLAKSLFLRRLATTLFLVVFGSPPVASDDVRAAPAEPFSMRKWIANKWRTSRRPSFALRLRPPAPAPGLLVAATSDSALADDTDATDPTTQAALAPCPPVYFRFELHENQRWWMGLDWTSALLPQERPSWCDVYLAPVSPPSAFVLPSESVMYLPVPGREGARTKRTARWRWLDEDWSVVRRTAGGGGGGGQGGKDPSASVGVGAGAGAGRHERSASFTTVGGGAGQDGHAGDVFTGEHKSTTKGLAEQAFVKGLEKLKARNILGSGGAQAQQAGGASVGAGSTAGPVPGSPTGSSMASTFAASVGFGSGIMGGGTSGAGAGASPARNRASMDEPRSRDSSTEDMARRHSAHPDVVNPPPGMGGAGASGSGSLAGQLVNGTTAHGMTTGGAGGTTAVAAGLAALMQDLDVQMDNDGWSYGDNKWEGMGPKGGLGRYTRRRRWQRTAICSETVEYIPAPAEIAASTSTAMTPKGKYRTSVTSMAKPAPPVLADVQPRADGAGYTVEAPASSISPSHAGVAGGERKLRTSSASSERDQMLRQRLRNAMGSVGA